MSITKQAKKILRTLQCCDDVMNKVCIFMVNFSVKQYYVPLAYKENVPTMVQLKGNLIPARGHTRGHTRSAGRAHAVKIITGVRVPVRI